jgi:endonuclease/exonuclease/phosphatase family metal-dependent hydrolase
LASLVAEYERVGLIRIASYNIRSLRDDRAAVVRVIEALRADVVCIQEAPRLLFGPTHCRHLADDLGLAIIAGGRAAAANLLLGDPSITVRATRAVLLRRYRRRDRRGGAMADLTIRGSRLVIAGFHLSGVDTERLDHIDQLHQAIDEFGPPGVPIIVAGDVNDEPGSPTWARLTARGVDAAAVHSVGDPLTNRTESPTRRIDALFLGPGSTVIQTIALDSPDVRAASDHRPVVADLYVAERPD